jgi:DNA-directed RNA polymerase specialized sigma24 family protein
MPHASGTSDKVGNGTVKLLEKEAEIDRVIDLFYDLKTEIIGQIQKLPADEYDVIYKSFVQGMSLIDIATEKNKHIDTIKKIRRSGIRNVRILETRNLKEAQKMLFDTV